ncbi:MAG TPA: 1-deoxy-D-xylulose-5-phosphate reductoisomerase [Candidatus Omnitrophota bacterium]|nr:1-deoxy-D-xylulose-5-phosphate reductoisomerase [Candidatus Omnitrophota bacterium]HRZ15445.1 1-deoxy-D-xylulose-5-phosphate reductoisomerase [Candidatus Omnitrophota bacterium]
MATFKRIAVFGSSGSIGCNALEVIRRYPARFKAQALCVNSQIDILRAQMGALRPALVCVTDRSAARRLRSAPGKKAGSVKVLSGYEGMEALCADRSIDHVLIAISGAAALSVLLKAIEHGKEVSLANKEALVMAGPIIMAAARRHKVIIRPIDSEQSAIWQCLNGAQDTQVKAVYLTASGGPFRGWTKKQLSHITLAQALKHPRWKMGRKITVDSATLMNKGLEILEAIALFNLRPEQVRVVVHPQSVIHSMVEFVDGAIMAQLSVPDMRIPIQYALSYPERLRGVCPPVDFVDLRALSFETPDSERFPSLLLAYEAARRGGTLPCVLNAANERAVEAFLHEEIGFSAIAELVARVMRKHRTVDQPSLNDILEADSWARAAAEKLLSGTVKPSRR